MIRSRDRDEIFEDIQNLELKKLNSSKFRYLSFNSYINTVELR